MNVVLCEINAVLVCQYFSCWSSVNVIDDHTIPSVLPWHCIATNSAEANFSGSPLHLLAGIGRKGKMCIQVSDAWLLPLCRQCMLCSVCEGREIEELCACCLMHPIAGSH